MYPNIVLSTSHYIRVTSIYLPSELLYNVVLYIYGEPKGSNQIVGKGSGSTA